MDSTALERLKTTHGSLSAHVSEDHIASAILSVIRTARSQGQSLEDVVAELQADDALLDHKLRQLLSDIVAQAWEQIA